MVTTVKPGFVNEVKSVPDILPHCWTLEAVALMELSKLTYKMHIHLICVGISAASD